VSQIIYRLVKNLPSDKFLTKHRALPPKIAAASNVCWKNKPSDGAFYCHRSQFSQAEMDMAVRDGAAQKAARFIVPTGHHVITYCHQCELVRLVCQGEPILRGGDCL
jgi:hypothetical protein